MDFLGIVKAMQKLILPTGTAPSLDTEGQVAWDTDDEILYVRNSSGKRGVGAVTRRVSIVVPAPTASSDFKFDLLKRAITLTKVTYFTDGGTNWVGQITIDGTDTQSSDSTASAGSATTVTSFSSANGAAGKWVALKTTSVGGTVNFVTIVIEYYES